MLRHRALPEPPLKISLENFLPEIRKRIYDYLLFTRTIALQSQYIVRMIRGRLRITTLRCFPHLYAHKKIMADFFLGCSLNADWKSGNQRRS
jgi:hypothetical protein